MEEYTCYDILCDTISRLRKQADITQEQLADQLGVSPQAVSKWESRRSCPDIGLLPQLARIFGTTIDQLFGLSPKAEELPDTQPIGIVKHLPWPTIFTWWSIKDTVCAVFSSGVSSRT